MLDLKVWHHVVLAKHVINRLRLEIKPPWLTHSPELLILEFVLTFLFFFYILLLSGTNKRSFHFSCSHPCSFFTQTQRQCSMTWTAMEASVNLEIAS